jgi:DivIVA domain-containing protein
VPEQSRPIPLALQGPSPEEVAAKTFNVVRRGFEPDAVRRFLEEVASTLRHARAREIDLTQRLADAEQRAASPVLDEAVLSAALGAETARVLKVAHEAAQEVVSKAEQRASALIEEASSLHASRAKAAEAEASRLLEEGQRAAREIVERTKAECRAMLEEAREARRRVLDDLAGRRRELHAQIEQLRAAKDALVEVFSDAATAVAAVQARLATSEEDAREAADEVAVRVRGDHLDGIGTSEASLVAPDPLQASDAEPDRPAEPAPQVVATLEVELTPQVRGALEAELAPQVAAALEVEPDPSTLEGHHGEKVASEDGEELAFVEAVDELGGAEPDDGLEEIPHVLSASPTSSSDLERARERAEETEEEATPEPVQASPSDALDVDALFARIRASRADEVARARTVLAEPDEELLAPQVAQAPSEVSEEASGVAEELRALGEQANEAGEQAVESPELAEGVVLAARRDEVLEPIRIDIARAIKRILRSQQNELLDAARTLKPSEVEELLAGEQAAVELAEAIVTAIAAAFAAGRGHAGAPVDEQAALSASRVLSRAIADEVIGAIEERIRSGIASLEASGAGEAEALGELVGVAYRDWKGTRVDAAAGEVALRAYAAGSVAGAAEVGAKVRWVLESVQPCADCDDNALSEPIEPGGAFPTGQTQPPLHAGCRCVLVAVPG